MKMKKQDADLRYDTRLLIYIWGKLCTKDQEDEKQVKKMMVKQAMMGMRAQHFYLKSVSQI